MVLNYKLYLVLFCLFYFICFIFGYASIKRFDPTLVPHMDDTKYYINIVKNGLNFSSDDPRYTRYIIPMIAHYIYKNVTFWNFDSAITSLLVINAIFVSVTGLALVHICKILELKKEILIASLFFFFTNYTIINTYLVGYLDSFNAMIFSLLSIYLLKNNWSYSILLISIISCMGKETIFITTSCFLFFWLTYDCIDRKRLNLKALKILIFHVLITGVSIFAIKYYASTISGHFNFIEKITIEPTYDFRHVLIAPFQLSYVYAPAFLILFCKIRLPKKWLLSSFFSMLVIFLVAIYSGITGHGLARISFELIGLIFAILCAGGLSRVLDQLKYNS